MAIKRGDSQASMSERLRGTAESLEMDSASADRERPSPPPILTLLTVLAGIPGSRCYGGAPRAGPEMRQIREHYTEEEMVKFRKTVKVGGPPACCSTPGPRQALTVAPRGKASSWHRTPRK